MRTICTHTNATINAYEVPIGTTEWPFAGSLEFTLNGVTTNVTASGNATVHIGQSVTVMESPGSDTAFATGLAISLLLFGIIGLIRKWGRIYHSGTLTRGDI